MRKGYSFFVDEDVNYENGDVVFRYKNITFSTKEGITEHPVYVIIQKNSIEFFYHGIILSENNKESHVHTSILKLPLSGNIAVVDNLSEKLNGIYTQKLFFRGIIHTSPNKDEYSYYQLFFNSKIESNSEIRLNQLLLDFLQDLEETKIFSYSPFYELAEVRLRENMLCVAIASKAKYLMYRKQFFYQKYKNQKATLITKALFKAEKQWLDILRRPDIYQNLFLSPWFAKFEKEYNDVLFNKKYQRSSWSYSIKKSKELSEENLTLLKDSAKWYLRRYNLFKGIKCILEYDNKKSISLGIILLSFVVTFLLLYRGNASQGSSVISIIVVGLMGLIPISIILSYVFRKLLLPIVSLLLPRLLMAIVSAWIFFITSEDLVKTGFDTKFSIDNWWYILFLVPVILFMSLEINNIAPELNHWEILKRVAYIIGIGVFYSLLTGIFFISTMGEKVIIRSGYLPIFYEKCLSPSNPTFELDRSNKAIVFNNIYKDLSSVNDIKLDSLNSNRIYEVCSKFDSISIFRSDYESIKKLFISERYIDSIDNNSDQEWVKYILENKKANLFELLKTIHYDFGLKIIGNIQLFYKVKISLFGKSFFIMIFPGMLVTKTFLALFVGIFVQLIFEDKPITEPL